MIMGVVADDVTGANDIGGMVAKAGYAATQALCEVGYWQFFNKTCSVFRGNIGTEFDAMLDALDHLRSE